MVCGIILVNKKTTPSRADASLNALLSVEKNAERKEEKKTRPHHTSSSVRDNIAMLVNDENRSGKNTPKILSLDLALCSR
jgi:predicted component of type VI protein secretion system